MKQLCFLLCALFSLHAVEVIEDLSTLEILTPSLQDIETRKLRLDNELEVYLISDPDTPQSAVALSVDVGQWQDPDDIQGLAHFIEHLVFLGNAKYPEHNSLQRYLDAHGGTRNAYTGYTHTNYHFTVNNENLPEALDLLAPMFITPLFDESLMRSEETIVDQEFQRAKQDDGWRLGHVLFELSNPDHPISTSHCGNIQTLHEVSPKQAREWFETHYSSNLMHLVVISPLSLDDLQEIVVSNFTSIPNRNFPPFTVEEPIFSDALNNQIVTIKPYQTLRELVLQWEIPSDETKSAQVIGQVLFQQAEGSLFTQLKDEGLIENIGASYDSFTSIFDLTFELTREGAERPDAVIERAFQAIATIQEEGISKEFFDENQAMNRLEFAYQTRSDLFETIKNHGRFITKEDLTTYPEKTLFATYYDQPTISQTAALLTPKNCQIILITPEGRFNRREQWMNIAYAVKPFPLPSQFRTHPNIHLPTPNPYIPRNLNLVHTSLSDPIAIADNEWGTLYFAPDTLYQVPQIAWIFTIKSEVLANTTAKAIVLRDLMVRSIKEAFGEELYLAEEAGISLTIGSNRYGLNLTVLGYSDKAPLLFEKLTDALKTSIPTNEAFAIYQESLKQDYDNFERQTPLSQGMTFCGEIICKEYVSPSEKSEAITNVTLEDLAAFFEAFGENTYIEGMLFGNLNERNARKIARTLHHYQKAPFPEGKTLRPKVLALQNNRGPYAISRQLKSANNATFLIFDQGAYSLTNRSAQQILAKAVSEPFFSTLRTEQKTGYAVMSFDQKFEDELYTIFAVESNTHDTHDLLARYGEFLGKFLKNLSEKRFQTIRESLITQIKQDAKNPGEMAGKLFTLAFDYNADFDFIEKRIAALEALTFEEYHELAQQFLGETNRRRVAILLNGTQAEPLRYRPITFGKFKKNAATYGTGGEVSASPTLPTTTPAVDTDN